MRVALHVGRAPIGRPTPARKLKRLDVIKPLLGGIVVLGLSCWHGAGAQTLREAVAGAWALNPQIQALEARRGEFIARRQAAGALFPGVPTVALSHDTDQLIADRRKRDTEVEIGTPIWLPGEGTATQQVAEAELVRTDAQIALARLAVAGTVREAAYKLALAQREAALAGRRIANARALAADVARRVRAGEAAPLEADQARGELFDAEATTRALEAQVAAARATLLSLTGLSRPPRNFAEPLAPEQDIARNPRLQAAARAIDAARAALRLVEIAIIPSPRIGVFADRSRDIFGTTYDTTVGVRLSVPLPSEARNAPLRAAALAKLAAAQAEYDAAAREIRLELATARQELAAAEAEAPLVAARLRAVRSALTRLQGSYGAGQIGLIEVLRARVAVFDAEVAQARNRLAIVRARGRVNQALGLAP